MKSKFAKIVDKTLGFALLMLAATAALRYFLPLAAAATLGVGVAASALLVLLSREKKREGKLAMSEAAADFFRDMAFESDKKPSALLTDGLRGRGVDAKARGGGVYVGHSAAFFCFGAPPDESATARMIARAGHYGASNITVFCREKPKSVADAEGVTVRAVGAEETYALFASLGALPETRFKKRKKRRGETMRAALGKDRLPRYALLTLLLAAIGYICGFPVTLAVCTAASALLFVVSAVYNAVKRGKGGEQKRQ